MKFCPKCGHELIQAEVAGIQRLKCSSDTCDYVFWDNPTPVVAGIVEYGKGVILVRQKGWPEKWHGLVTGFLERGETPEDGILRELKEELGLEGQIIGFVGYYPFYELNQIILAFHLKASGEICLGEELESYKLIPPEKLRPWALGTGPALKEWLEKRTQQSL
jgi:NAD+ diphosphatase